MRVLSIILVLFGSSSQAAVFFAKYGDYNSGFHNSAHNACISLGGIIYPHLYAEPITGVRGIVDETHNSTCATQYSYKSAGNVYWYDKACNNPDELGRCEEEVILCEDGLPEVIGTWDTCDRLPLKQCVDGSVVDEANGICDKICTDYDTCYEFALDNLEEQCAQSTYFEFSYENPDNGSYSCTQIADNSPDHNQNGGNEDGNIYNDPSSDYTPISESHPDSLATAISVELQNDFGNLERAIREGSEENNESNADIINELSQINSTLDDLVTSNNTEETYSTPNHYLSSRTIEQANTDFYNRVSSSQIIQAFSSIDQLIDISSAQCPSLEIDLPDPINQTISTNIHCELFQSIQGLLSPVMLAIWTLAGFRIFAST